MLNKNQYRLIKLLFIILIISKCNLLTAQRFNIIELLEISRCDSDACFNDIIFKKGFTFTDGIDHFRYYGGYFVGTKEYKGYSDDKSKIIKFKNGGILKKEKNGDFYSLLIETVDSKYYSKLESEMFKLGFITDSNVRLEGIYSNENGFTSPMHPELEIIKSTRQLRSKDSYYTLKLLELRKKQ